LCIELLTQYIIYFFKLENSNKEFDGYYFNLQKNDIEYFTLKKRKEG